MWPLLSPDTDNQLFELGCEELGWPGGPDGRSEESEQFLDYGVWELRRHHGYCAHDHSGNLTLALLCHYQVTPFSSGFTFLPFFPFYFCLLIYLLIYPWVWGCETCYRYVTQASLKLKILLTQSSESWPHTCMHILHHLSYWYCLISSA